MFSYADAPVRVVMIDGEPWFVLNDLLAVLGIARFNRDRIDKGCTRRAPLPSGRGMQETVIVSEAGMYELVNRP